MNELGSTPREENEQEFSSARDMVDLPTPPQPDEQTTHLPDRQPGESEQERTVRLSNWINAQDAAGRFQALPTQTLSSKTVVVSPDAPDIVVKRYGTSYIPTFQRERSAFDYLKEHLSERFLPETEFVHIEHGAKPENKLHIIQTRLEGVHFKTAIMEAQDREQDMPYDDPFARTIRDPNTPDEWVKYKGQVLREGLSADQQAVVRREAEELYKLLEQIEKDGRIVDDIDFFITPEGHIQIMDYWLRTKADYDAMAAATKAEGEPVYASGAEQIKLIFGL